MSETEGAQQGAVQTLQALIRLDTTNPPGNERPAAELLASVLRADGVEPQILEAAPGRANLIARLRGTGQKPPLLLSAHLDVVPADPAGWERPPFSGEIHDGWIWGRGAIDMKHFAAMAVHVMGLLRRSGARLSRDVIFAGVADEEAGCQHGSQFLVDHHPELVRAEHVLNELGGFTMYFGAQRVYPLMVAEKGQALLKLSATGPGGHGSVPDPDSPVVRLARAVERLGTTRLPMHESEIFQAFIRTVARSQPAASRLIMPLMLQPALSGLVLDRLLPDKTLARTLKACLSNTATPTILRAGTKVNAIPTRAEAEVDGRTLPGQTAADLAREVRAVVGAGVEVEVLREAPPVATDPSDPLVETIRRVVQRHDPGALVVPSLVPGYTDAKAWHKLGSRCLGFTPLRMPAGVKFAQMYHGVNERVSLEGFQWGLKVLHEVVTEHCV